MTITVVLLVAAVVQTPVVVPVLLIAAANLVASIYIAIPQTFTSLRPIHSEVLLLRILLEVLPPLIPISQVN